MLAKRFFYVCAGLLCLALAYHLGATSATAQAPGNPVVGVGGGGGDNRQVFVAVTANGDAFLYSPGNTNWQPAPNVFGAPAPGQQSTWGALKMRYR